MIHFHEVSKRYPGGHEALCDVSFHVPRGEMVFLTGHSGAGKSTLLRLITVSERSTRGQIVVGGLNLARLPRRRVPAFRRHIGVVFQDHRLLMSRSVRDNVALPLVIGGFGHSEITRRVRAALEVVGLRGKEDAYPITLSGGEQQRVGIARAVVHRPAVLLADEPTGNLDPELSDEIMHLFERFHQVGVTLIIASHDVALIERMACPVLRLAQGTLAEIPARCLAEAEGAV